MKKTIFIIISLLAIRTAIAANEVWISGDAHEIKWKSLGGNFARTGLSDSSGPESGCVKWQFETTRAVSASVTVGTDNTVYIPCEDGKLYALDPNGLLIWNYDANTPLISSPTIGPDGTIYVGGMNGKLYAVDINGNLKWTHSTEGFVYSSPAVSSEGNIYIGSQDGVLYTLDRDGSELWCFETKGPGKVPRGSIFASPAIGADETVYILGLYDPNLYALDPNDGSSKWTCHFESQGWPFASPVIAYDGTIYQTLLYDTNLYAIEPQDGGIIWSVDLADPDSDWFDPNYAQEYGDADGWSEPALGPDGTIYVSFDDPYLRAVDPTGKIKWVRRLGNMGGFTLTVSSDGKIYAACDDGNIYVLNSNGEEIARFQSQAWLNFPVIVDNLLIFTDSRDNSFLITYENNKWHHA
jgi:outer membrane protein assembly factor BamB